ncbi:MAG: carboxypeptidase regulatory-like domain-containing protein [Spirochaetaceae bacterium]|jgi:tetratricopeptide (TPR) repeat protein|nr:carboxypeptidase regulatory-like domain-containing protein [Spirochaetaceae bacterium]
MKAFLLLLAAAALSAGSCASGPAAGARTQSLYGMIYDGENRPVNNAALYVDGAYRSSSDINGHFIITGLKPKTIFRVNVQKQGFEPIDIDAAYTDPSHVLYIRILSGDQLLAEAEEAVRDKRWGEAEALLDRALDAGAEAAPVHYVRAILACAREEYAEALLILGSIAENLRDAPYLYLLMADICQYRLEAPGQARSHLERFLALRYDEAVSQRLQALGEL